MAEITPVSVDKMSIQTIKFTQATVLYSTMHHAL